MPYDGPIAQPVRRGCGTRKEGNLYLECGLSGDGLPPEWFLRDPPVPLPADFPCPIRGVGSFEKDGVTHIVDYVGCDNYPNPSDFFEEFRRFGSSRVIQGNFPDFEKLTNESRHILVHKCAYIVNVEEFRAPGPEERPDWQCPKRDPLHAAPCGGAPDEAPCAGLWWENLTSGSVPDGEPKTSRERIRELPSFHYFGRAAPEGVEAIYSATPAIFLVLPIHRIVGIQSDSPEFARKLEAARQARLPVCVEEQ